MPEIDFQVVKCAGIENLGAGPFPGDEQYLALAQHGQLIVAIPPSPTL
jgi:hypothetical protein